MTTFAIGDIHGNRSALEDVLRQLEPLLTSDDTVVFLGDYIDRGLESKACVDRILAFRDAAPAEVVALCGNHEDWLVKTSRDFTFHSWVLGMDAWATIASYSPAAAATLRRAAKEAGRRLYEATVPLPYDVFFDTLPPSHLEFFQTLETYRRTPDCLCVHAGFDPQGGPIEQQPSRMLIWGGTAFWEKYRGPETVVYGHWNNADMSSDGWPLPRVDAFAMGLDTSKHGVATAVQLPGLRVIQSGRHMLG